MPDDGLLGAREIHRLAETLELRPTKTLGQNFVVDANTVRRIVRTADLSADDVVVEVGPGLGSLTLGLLSAVHRVAAVEIDARLAAQLPATVAERLPAAADRLAVLTADAVRTTGAEIEAALGGPPTVLVANLPYNVAVPVLLHLLPELPRLRSLLVMVQAEVAARLCAGPGSRTYGAPSVKLAWWGRARPAGAVPRSVFWPVPRVDSALVAADLSRPFAHHPGDGERLRAATFTVVDAAFAQRRKTLRSALAGLAGSPAAAEAWVRSAGIEPSSRGEALDVEAFVRLGSLGAAAGAAVPSLS